MTTKITTEQMESAARIIAASRSEDTDTRASARAEYAAHIAAGHAAGCPALDGGPCSAECSAAKLRKLADWDRDRDLGEAVLAEWTADVYPHRTTSVGELAANQIALPAGYLATSPAWRIYTFSPRGL